MMALHYKHKLVRLGFLFFILLAKHNIAAAAKKDKKKEVAVVSPTVQKKSSDADHANTNTKAKLQSEQTELEIENALHRARLEKELSAIISQIERLRVQKERKRLEKETEDENARREHEKAMLLLNMEKEKLNIELELAQARFMKQMEKYNIQLIKLDKEIQLEKGQTQLLQETTNRLQAEIEALQAKAVRDKRIEKKPIYLNDPLNKQTNTLVLSDRCIELNGTITPWKANYIVDQIHYFNNKNSVHPIFLIIGYSSGGFVSAGCNILQAIEHSKAPVYVVVKAFAASMAAIITTLATKSYAYPNAEILHHQPSSWFLYGNLRATKEQYEVLNKIWKRLGGRVAKKMGISLKAFDKKLYEKSMYGDWMEYGDYAKKIKWVDYVINGIQHSAISSLPDAADYSFEKFIKEQYGFNKEKETETSQAVIQYHALAPHDFDYSYNPDKKTQMMMSLQGVTK
ncbi:ClpP family protease [Candidatus Cardinium sp. cByotN1]|nr:ATP-dependent Clp protease proteolytic subunit [Candidatus Cardinium sp. cByotN1]